MHIVYEPIWGSQERWNLSLVKPILTVGKYEEDIALSNGWLINNGEWYHSRSVRIKTASLLEKYKDYTTVILNELDSTMTNVIGIMWMQYLERKHLPSLYSPFADKDRASWLLLYDKDNRLVSFTKMVKYEGGIESCLNAYREEPGSIGKRMLELEVTWAHNNGYQHLYIGPGHERSSTYKADIPGFEYWTGREWSTNAIEYKNLCIRDSEINDLTQLSELWNSRGGSSLL